MHRAVRAAAAWVPAVVLVPLVVAGAVRVSVPDAETSLLESLAQVEVGTTWVYAVRDRGGPSGTRTVQVTGQAIVDTDSFDAVTLASRYTDYPGVGESRTTLYLKLTDRALEQLGVIAGHTHRTVDPPAPAYRLPLEEGDSWDYDGTVGEARLRYTVTVASVGDTEVGGRTFEDCRHLVTTLRWKYAEDQPWTPDTTREEWTCPGFGPVRSTESDAQGDVELTEELVEFHSEETDWFAQAPDRPEVTTVPGDTLGLDPGRSNTTAGEATDRLAWSDVRSARFDFPPVGDDEVMVLAERDGEVSAMEQDSGEIRWRVRLQGPIVVTPAIAGDRVLVADARKNLWALSLADGSARWVRRFADVVSASPLVVTRRVVVPTEDGLLTALDLADSRTLWEVTGTSSVQSAPALAGPLVVAAARDGTVAAYDVADGDRRWRRGLPGTLLAGPAVSGDRVVVGDDEGLLHALDPATGEVVWERRTVYYPSTSFAVSADAVVSNGDHVRIEAYDLDDGDLRWRAAVDPTRVAPVVVGDDVVTASVDGTLTARDATTGEVTRSWSLPRPLGRDDGSVHMPFGVVGGALVTSADYGTEGLGSALYAYHLDASGGSDGVWFRSELRDAADGASGPATLAGDTLFVPGHDQAVYRVEPGGEATRLFQAEGLPPGVVAAGDVVLAQKDDELSAYPLAGEEPLWTYPTPAGFSGQLPAVSGDTVFVPRGQEGLAAVSLADGRERWRVPLDLAFGSSAPLALPDGDVVYAGAALARYDGATGRQRWSVVDGVSFGPVAHDDGRVFADLAKGLSESGLGAYDARTGEQLWFHAHANQQLGIGPAAADGVVVAADSQGLVAAFDAASGEELWRLQLLTAIGGQPWIHDGVAYLAEAGRKEDLYQRDYRVSAHDLRTGRFLGSFQPPGSLFTFTPSVWPSGGALLAPGSFTRAVVTIIRPQR